MLVQRSDQMEKRLLIHRLDRAGDVAMPILERIIRRAARPQQSFQRGREQVAKLGRAARPLIGDLLLVMAKIGEIELVSTIGSKPYDLSHGVHECRLAIGREPHDLVLVAVMRKAEILRQRLIKDAERMREIHASVDGNGFAPADPPGSAGEIAEAIDRNDDSFVKRRNMKSRGKMREMMLDLVHLATKALSGEARRQQLLNAPARLPIFEPVEE